MSVSLPRAMKVALSYPVLIAGAFILEVSGANVALAEQPRSVAACRSVDYAFEDQERDYYAFYAFDRNYGDAKEARPPCDAPPPPYMQQVRR